MESLQLRQLMTRLVDDGCLWVELRVPMAPGLLFSF